MSKSWKVSWPISRQVQLNEPDQIAFHAVMFCTFGPWTPHYVPTKMIGTRGHPRPKQMASESIPGTAAFLVKIPLHFRDSSETQPTAKQRGTLRMTEVATGRLGNRNDPKDSTRCSFLSWSFVLQNSFLNFQLKNRSFPELVKYSARNSTQNLTNKAV